MTDTDFTNWPDSYTYNGTEYIHLCDRRYETIASYKQWSFFDITENGPWAGMKAILPTKREEITYCECHSCEGHSKLVEIPEGERYWQPDPMPCYMPVLENQPKELFRVLSKLGKKR